MIERETRDGIVVLRLAHGKASALDLELAQALRGAIEEASGARAVVLGGTGSIFSAGVDLKRVIAGGAGYVRSFLPAFDRALAALFACPCPVVASLNGHAIAGGYVLAAAADLRLLADGGGRIGVPELQVGVPFPALALEILRFALGSGGLQAAALAAEPWTAAEALGRRAVDELVAPEELLERALARARSLADIPPGSFALTKRMLREPALEAARRASENERQVLDLWTSETVLGAVEAYVARTLRR